MWGTGPSNLEAARTGMSLPSSGVETFNNVEYHIFSWSSALISGQAEIEDHKHLICAVDEVKMVDTVTLEELADFLEWNLSVMESGRHPFLNHLGQELDGPRAQLAGQPLHGATASDSYRACFAAWLGDLKERVLIHKYERNYRFGAKG